MIRISIVFALIILGQLSCRAACTEANNSPTAAGYDLYIGMKHNSNDTHVNLYIYIHVYDDYIVNRQLSTLQYKQFTIYRIVIFLAH